MTIQASAALTAGDVIALHGERDYDDLLSWIGERSLVLLGEASHGTHEFYRERC